MRTVFAPVALLPDGWAKDVCVTIAPNGTLADVRRNASAQPGDILLPDQALLPAMPNLHSHAFQRAMAGMTERRSEQGDSFWTWRQVMYRFLDILTPEQIGTITAFAYMEMLEAGYAAVGEFHYLHHQPLGIPYADPAELSRRIIDAANQTGIGLTHLPVLYCRGGVDDQRLSGGQLRFAHDYDDFLRLLDLLQRDTEYTLGCAAHSLRAVSPEDFIRLQRDVPHAPLHIHAAEQRQEVTQVEAAYGKRPIALLNQLGLSPRTCVIHATHMQPAETLALAASGAVAGLCPITEANLGDGLFDAVKFRQANGVFGIGTDSNIRISLTDELRTLEYGQRLKRHERNVLADVGCSVGETLYQAALKGGAQALQRDCGAIKIGAKADLLTIDLNQPSLCALPHSSLLDGWIFAADDNAIRNVWSAGRHCVVEGYHVDREKLSTAYRRVIKEIADSL